MGTITGTSRESIAQTLLSDYGTLWSRELGIDLERGTPSPLFRWLCAAILLSARISERIATKAARALAQQGWTTAEKMARSTWEERTKTLNQSGYARYDESTSRMLGADAELLLERYHGDLRRLREQSQRDPSRQRQLLKEFKGLGDVGVDIFFREAQRVWDELYPFADRRALRAAQRLELAADATELARLVDKSDFARLVAALVRVDLSGEHDKVRSS